MKNPSLSCKNVFQNGKDIPDPAQVTQILITLIEQMERSKALLSEAGECSLPR